MQYFSTRNQSIQKRASEAILEGIAEDGGLYLPASLEAARFPMARLHTMSPKEISVTVLSLLLGREELFPEEGSLEAAVARAYDGQFENGDYAPLCKVGKTYVMELYHGPTCAFKDVALRMLPELLAEAKRAEGVTDEIVILTATSGDTGSAALYGFSDAHGTRILVFYPKDGVSAVQERQMTSCKGENTCVCAIEGNFDDAQSAVKTIFRAMALPEGVRLSSANSINIGRLAPQVAYYFKAYGELLKNGEIRMGEKLDFVVPTGNFGDILAGYFAMQMGLPVGRLVCASNENDVLFDFFRTGVYDRNRAFRVTASPSMDILISSNLERLIAMVCGTEACKKYMKELRETGRYTLTESELARIREVFDAGMTTDAETAETIRRVYREYGYLMDTHTAVAWHVHENSERENKTVVLSTASAYKFAASVMDALGESYTDDFDAVERLQEITRVPIPRGLDGIRDRAIVHRHTVSRDGITDFVKQQIERKE
ncbi:MAG: threonine synthase [Clostridia bacterium]|nr:threonine synthase [Clostridia bacterium]